MWRLWLQLPTRLSRYVDWGSPPFAPVPISPRYTNCTRRRDSAGYLGVQPHTTFSPLSQAQRQGHGADGRVSSTGVLLGSICESSARSQPSELLIGELVKLLTNLLVELTAHCYRSPGPLQTLSSHLRIRCL